MPSEFLFFGAGFSLFWFVLVCIGRFWHVSGTGFEDSGLIEQQTPLVQAEAAGGEVVASEVDDVVAKQAEAAEFGLRVVSITGDGVGGGGVTKGHPMGQFFGERRGEEALHFRVASGGALGEFQSGLVRLPVAEAAEFPFREVLLGYGASGELGREDGLDFGEGIEPREKVFEFLAVMEAAVELLTDEVGEAGDFAGASHESKWSNGVVEWWSGGVVE